MNKQRLGNPEHGDWLVEADAKSVSETLCINLIFGNKKGLLLATFLPNCAKNPWSVSRHFLRCNVAHFFPNHRNLTSVWIKDKVLFSQKFWEMKFFRILYAGCCRMINVHHAPLFHSDIRSMEWNWRKRISPGYKREPEGSVGVSQLWLWKKTLNTLMKALCHIHTQWKGEKLFIQVQSS